MKFGQLIEHNMTNIFLQKHAENKAETSSTPPFAFFFKKAFYKVKMWSAGWFQYILIALNLEYNKNKLYKTLDYLSSDKLNFDFLEKGLGLVSPPHSVHDFSRKMFLMLYSIN